MECRVEDLGPRSCVYVGLRSGPGFREATFGFRGLGLGFSVFPLLLISSDVSLAIA